jgi:hypothetical protein
MKLLCLSTLLPLLAVVLTHGSISAQSFVGTPSSLLGVPIAPLPLLERLAQTPSAPLAES